MGKRKNRSKRSLASLPKGLPVRGGNITTAADGAASHNPFDVSHHQSHKKRAKFHVHNRGVPGNNKNKPPSALAAALQRRQEAIRTAYRQSKSANVFSDKRIGEYNPQMSAEEKQLQRLVRERSRRSKRVSKYSLQDDDEDDDEHVLTHKGKAVDQLTAADHAELLSDDDEDETGQLDAADTALHFGGGRTSRNDPDAIYGGGGSGSGTDGLSLQYTQRKLDLDEMILRRKIAKAERLQSKERQVEAFEAMDGAFAELKHQLQFRDKESELQKHLQQKRQGTLSPQDQEMADWDVEMKTYLYQSRTVKATDRTKTVEEIAQEEADRLHELETRRLARMNGDFEHDDFSDVSDDGDKERQKKKNKKKRAKTRQDDNPEALSDSDDGNDYDDDKITTRFTADGLVQIDKDGVVIGKVGENNDKKANKEQPSSENDDDGEPVLASELPQPLTVGTAVNASYRAEEQYDGNESWFTGTISRVHRQDGDDNSNSVTYDIDYDDGDFEEGVKPCHIKVMKKSALDLEKEDDQKAEEAALKRMRLKAKEKAREEIPYVFEVPTTLDALHDMIGTHATTGADASLIVQRIHKANSVRLDQRKNATKMQNFYDVLLRRFVLVGDAIYTSGNGGPELGRYAQLDSLTKTLYAMAQDAPDSASAVWSRRLGIFQAAHAKRLRDAELVVGGGDDDDDDDDNDEVTAWPSTGVILVLRALGHIFPVTDLRHPVVTPALFLLGQMVSHTPVVTLRDAASGLLCAGLLLEYTKEAKRVVPEAHGYIAGVIRLFAGSAMERHGKHPLPTLAAAAYQDGLSNMRRLASNYKGAEVPKLSLERSLNERAEEMAAAILFSALHLADTSAKNLAGSTSPDAGKETFAEVTSSILALDPKSKVNPLPPVLCQKVASVVSTISSQLEQAAVRAPLQRRAALSTREKAIKSLAPRLENPDKYSLSNKDKGKKATQAAADRARREYRREHKAVARELRMDAAMMEQERRRQQDKKDAAAKAKRQKAFSWLEGEQAAMNQQVRQGGGLLQGGGMGAARAKAATAKLGIKKGGKF